MKKSPTYFLKTLLLIFGGGLLLFSGFMPLIRTFTVDHNMNGTSISGFDCPLWYAILIAAAIIFAIGYFFHTTVNKVLVFVFAPIFALVIMLLTFVFTFSIAIDPGDVILQIGEGYPIAVSGALLVVIATAISVLRKKEVKTTSHSDLLDEM